MSRRRQREGGRGARRGGPGWWPIGAVVVLAMVAVAGLIWLGQAEPEPARGAALTSGNIKGDSAVPVTVEVWSDFQCPACRAFALDPGRRLAETFVAEGRAKLVWRHFAFLGQESIWAAEAAECAGEQGQFWTYHDKLFAEQAGVNRGAFSKDNLKRYAGELGLDRARFDACLDTDRYAAKVQAETQAGRQKGVRATPTLFVDGHKLEGVPRFEQLAQLIEAAAPTVIPMRPRGGP